MELSASFTRALLAGFGQSYADLLRIAHRSTGSRDEARDLVHDVWLRLAEHERCAAAPATDVNAAMPRDVTAYLAVMAQCMALDAHRRQQRLLRHVDEATLHAQMAPAHAPDAAESLMYRQALATLEQAMAALPERTRQVFVAHRVQGDKQPAIAARLGVSLNTVERDLIQAGDCIADALQRWHGAAGTAASGRKPGRRRSLSALLGVVGLYLGGPLTWQQWQAWRHQHVQWQASWGTPRGQLQRHRLPDGSVLQLDAQSAAQLQFFATRREVLLTQGAAFFEVVADAERPFAVQATGVRVVVLGTRFGVELSTALDGSPQVTVQVESGRVRVEPAPGAAATLLLGGEGLRVDGATATPLASGDEAAPWRHGELVFTDVPLGQALLRLGRYAPFALEASPEAARLPVNGRVRIARAQAWVQALPRAMPVRVLPLPAEQGPGWRVALAR
jgi:RNA polymerase sigma factor (sigma-70 family)